VRHEEPWGPAVLGRERRAVVFHRHPCLAAGGAELRPVEPHQNPAKPWGLMTALSPERLIVTSASVVM